ncbi:hypothetical protein XIS1_1700065 [Xenorhabdus innexi]|uniref:Uncharacterized protein n=1 Tax=Xenorhabdus innexi TaxID=290109 RepID=A0A1N6MW66_9GAMM|nr:hypothetical protein XIS1_1700065 [Xenorhabdus innexi]
MKLVKIYIINFTYVFSLWNNQYVEMMVNAILVEIMSRFVMSSYCFV